MIRLRALCQLSAFRHGATEQPYDKHIVHILTRGYWGIILLLTIFDDAIFKLTADAVESCLERNRHVLRNCRTYTAYTVVSEMQAYGLHACIYTATNCSNLHALTNTSFFLPVPTCPARN